MTRESIVKNYVEKAALGPGVYSASDSNEY
jgi:hypothetical protein